MDTLNLPGVAEFRLVAPQLLIGALAFVVLLWDAILKPKSKSALLTTSLAGILLALALTVTTWTEIGEAGKSLFFDRIVLDRFGLFLNALLISVTGLVMLMARDYLEREDIHVGEFYSLMFFALFGMLLLVLSADLIMMFIAIEIMSISVYVLVAFNRSSYRCIEGALKYLILGAFASGFLLYGISMIYGQVGSTQLADIQRAVSTTGARELLPFGVGLLLVGLGFKVGAAPFHMWVPDVYEGAATPVTAFMATAVKTAAFAALIRVLVALSSASQLTEPILWGMAGLTIVVGNIAAIRQSNLKRMLAYSGIAHTGYLLTGLLAIRAGASMSVEVLSSLSFYLASYVFMTLGAFAILIMVGRKEAEPLEAEDWAGLGFRYPWLGAGMTLFMLSMGGLPPTAGFFAKFYLFRAVVDAGFTTLVILAVLTSAISFYYYLRVVVQMYMLPDPQRWTPDFGRLAPIALGIAALATLVMGLLPSGPISVLDWARASLIALL